MHAILTWQAICCASWQAPAGALVRPEPHSQCADEGGCSVDEAAALERFFVRYNRALLDQAAIEREQQRLQSHNQQLRNRWAPPRRVG